jgi:hypothetical protein
LRYAKVKVSQNNIEENKKDIEKEWLKWVKKRF